MKKGKPKMSSYADESSLAVEVGERLRLLRATAGKTVKQFAEFLREVEPGTLSGYELGRRMLPPHVANIIKDQTHVTTDWLYNGDASGMHARLIAKLTPDGEYRTDYAANFWDSPSSLDTELVQDGFDAIRNALNEAEETVLRSFSGNIKTAAEEIARHGHLLGEFTKEKLSEDDEKERFEKEIRDDD